MVKAKSRGQGVLSLVPLPKIDKMYAMLNGSTVYCTSGYLKAALSTETQKDYAFVTSTCKFEFKKVPFGLVLALMHFQQLINKGLKGLPLSFGYLEDILIFGENTESSLAILELCLMD